MLIIRLSNTVTLANARATHHPTVIFMSYHQFQDENGESYGSFEVFFYHDSTGTPCRIGPRGFYWHACFPGCFPDGDTFGPFETENEAINDALAC